MPGPPQQDASPRGEIKIERLGAAQLERAQALFVLIADVFEMDAETLSDGYLRRLLQRDDFWALAAVQEGRLVGGLTAYTLPLTRAEVREVFLYDIAVRPEFHRQGIGRKLVAALRAQAAPEGITVIFVAADEEDTHALDFYRSIGGSPSPVTIFTFGAEAG
jgi:aminoglycoside 3-N-acetyltransferase I